MQFSFLEHLVGRQAKLNMAKSSVPVGDMDIDRAQKRITQTTSKSFFKKVTVIFHLDIFVKQYMN